MKCLAVLRALSECTTFASRDTLAEYVEASRSGDNADDNVEGVSRIMQLMSGNATELATTHSRWVQQCTDRDDKAYYSIEGRLVNRHISALEELSDVEHPAEYFSNILV